MKKRIVIRGLVNVVAIAVLTAASASFAQVINVDFGGGNNYTGASANGPIASGTTWNYFTGGNSQSKLDLTNDSGVATTVDLAFGSSGWGVGAPNTLNNLQGDYVFMTSTPGTLTISGLTPGGAYNIALITTPQASGLFATDFTINEITFRATDRVGAGSNVNGPLTFTVGVTHVLFSNVIADGSGVITVTVNKKSTSVNGVLSGLQIETSLTPPSSSFGVVSVDLGGGSNYVGTAANGPIVSAGTTWNYFIGDNGKSQWHLTNDTGVATTLVVTFGGSGWGFFADNVPNNLQGSRGYTSGGPVTNQISGLKPGGVYNLALITMGYSTDFTVGATTINASASASAGSNANGPLTFTAGVTHVLFTNVVAGVNGSITFTTAKAAGSSFGTLAGFQIAPVPPQGTVLIIR
jgi:hypothetical protein